MFGIIERIKRAKEIEQENKRREQLALYYGQYLAQGNYDVLFNQEKYVADYLKWYNWYNREMANKAD